ncbi:MULTISPECIES: hypothetical protein [unclassified Knoellia]|uniref:hypothetical protein n=1 Tax=Knoellia altitudinis TaxID=3404795 RepID=UPI003623F9EE
MTNHDDHTFSSTPGPDEDTAPRARRFAVAGAAALMLALGGAGAAYAVGGGGADAEGIQYGTFVESPAGPGATGVADREDCPEKDGSGSGSLSATPETPDAGTL